MATQFVESVGPFDVDAARTNANVLSLPRYRREPLLYHVALGWFSGWTDQLHHLPNPTVGAQHLWRTLRCRKTSHRPLRCLAADLRYGTPHHPRFTARPGCRNSDSMVSAESGELHQFRL